MLHDATLVEDVRILSRVNNVRAAAVICGQWLIIAATIAIAASCNSWIVYLIAMIVIASRQHALVVLMHDATHYRLFTKRTANEHVSDFCCAFPMGLSTLGYREEHLAHHHDVNTRGDPYFVMFQDNVVWQWPKTRWAAARLLLGDVLAWNIPRHLRMLGRWTPLTLLLRHRRNPSLATRCLADVLLSLLYWSTIVVGLTVLGGWKLFLILWLCPALTLFPLFVRLRWIAEHLFRPATDELHDTRHVDGTLLERLSIAPLNINYHIAHHLYPSVPFYNLPRLHDRLMQTASYQEEARCYRSYLGRGDSVMAELLRPRGVAPSKPEAVIARATKAA